MFKTTATLCEQLHEDIDLLDAAGWPPERIAHELSELQIEEMIDCYLARGDEAVAGALAATLAGPGEFVAGRGHARAALRHL